MTAKMYSVSRLYPVSESYGAFVISVFFYASRRLGKQAQRFCRLFRLFHVYVLLYSASISLKRLRILWLK